MNNLLKNKPHYIVVGIAFAIAIFTNDVAFNFGRLFAVTVMSIGVASLIGRKSEPQKALTFKLFAAFIPLIVISFQVYSEYNQKQSLNSIKQTLSEQKDMYRSALLDDDVKVPAGTKNVLNFSQFKPASSLEDLYKQLSDLIKLSNNLTISATNEQKKLFAEIGWNESLSPEKLASLSDAVNLRHKANRYDAFIDKNTETYNTFLKGYKDAFHLIATNYPKEIKSFDASFQQSVKTTDEFTAVQKETIREIIKLSSLLEEAYRKQLVQYSPSEKNLVFYDNALLNRYNQILQNMNLLVQKEEQVIKNKYESLQRLEKKLPK